MNSRRVSLGPLGVTQADLAPERLQSAYDLCISVASWESRCVTVFQKLPPLRARWEVWSFESRDPERSEAKDRAFQRLSELRNETVHRLSLAGSLEYENNFELLHAHMRAHAEEKGRPLDILFDMTCMPKKYILFLLGMSFRNEYVRSLDFAYAEGAYMPAPEVDSEGLLGWKGSEGEWSSVQVPYLEADNFMPDARGLIVALGAEISASVPFVERYEPTRILLLSVEDSAKRIDITSVAKERSLLAELEKLPITTSEAYALEDVASVAAACISFCAERRDLSISGLAIGSKPHALALGLAALSAPNLEIVCRLPSHYLAGDVVPTGRVFLYATEDRFEPRMIDNALSDFVNA